MLENSKQKALLEKATKTFGEAVVFIAEELEGGITPLRYLSMYATSARISIIIDFLG